jgi:hypothetical protein
LSEVWLLNFLRSSLPFHLSICGSTFLCLCRWLDCVWKNRFVSPCLKCLKSKAWKALMLTKCKHGELIKAKKGKIASCD